MWSLFVAVMIGILIIIPCWKAFISALLLEKDPEKWEKWQQKEHENRKRRDEKIAKAVNLFLTGAGWVERKIAGEPPPDKEDGNVRPTV